VPDLYGAQISQIWIFSYLTATEPAPVQNGGSVRATSVPLVTFRS
jgi:hypothetical protein